jgi:dipeptidyl aminopeptidase/acylaminoacyl peptidase
MNGRPHRLAHVAAIAALVLLLPSIVSAGDGELLEQRPVALDDDAIGRLLAGVDEPARVERLGGILRKVAETAELRAITYRSDGLRVKGYLAMPRDGDALPCVIFNRGGNREFGALDDLRAAVILGRIAARGYIVVASQYRGNAGGEGTEQFGGTDVNDVLSLIPLLESLPRADAARIGMYGWSRGGMMTYLALARTDRVRAAVVGAGVADAADMVERRPEMATRVLAELAPDWSTDREGALAARSAIRWPGRLPERTPILLLHGSADWRVHPSQALRMASALLEAKRPFRLVVFEGGDHGLSEHRAEVERIIDDWLDTYVRDGARWPSLEPHGR